MEETSKEKKGSIFIVEDNIINLKLIKDILDFHNYEIFEAHNGREALEMIQEIKGKTDLILMDLQLPEIDGLELIRIFKKDPEIQHIPIIVLSAHAMEIDMHKAVEAGCNNYITKPINVEDFINKIESFFLHCQTT